jgi:hypothetical protein
MKRISVAVLLLLAVGLPCCAREPNIEQLKATAVSLTAKSAKGGENATFQVCKANNGYALCIFFSGADASDFADKIYTNSDFAKDMALQGFVTVGIRNATSDKALSQEYVMNVTPEGWAANDQCAHSGVHDSAECIAVMLAEGQHDSAKKVIALRTFIQSYPNSVTKKRILERLMDAQSQAGDKEGSVATAKQLLAAGGASDTARVHALWVIVYLRMAEAKAGTNTDQYLKEAKEYSEIGMQALEQVSKPEYMSEEQLATFKSSSTAAFKDAISTEYAHSAAEKQAVSEHPVANAHSVQAAASNTGAIPGRLSSEQMKAILAAADEENRRAFSDLVQQTSAVPSALLSIQEGIRQKYPRMGGTDNCRGRTSELQRRLGRSLTPKQIDDIDEMNGVLMGCAGQYFAFAPPNSRNITVSANQAVADAKRRQQQIESTKNAILQVEAALDAGDLIRANQLFRGLAGASSQPTFAQSYLQQTQSLRQDVGAYLQAVGMDHQQSTPLVQQLKNLGREASLLNESASGRPLTQAYLQQAIKNGVDASRRQIANLPAFQFSEASYRIPTAISEGDELALIARHIKTIDESLAQVSEVRAIIAQPEAMKAAEEVVGGTEATTLKATADQIGSAEHMRASLVDTQNSLQAKIAAEQKLRDEEQARKQAQAARAAEMAAQKRAEEQKQAKLAARLAEQTKSDSLIDTQCVEGGKNCEGEAAGIWLVETQGRRGTSYSCPDPQAEALIKISLVHGSSSDDGSKLDVASVHAFQYGTDVNLWGASVYNPPKYGEKPDGSYHLRGERQFAAQNADITLELHPRGNGMKYFISARRSGSGDILFLAQGTCTKVADKSGFWAINPSSIVREIEESNR